MHSSTLDRRRMQSLRKQIFSGRASVQVVVGAIAIAAIILALTTFRSGESSQESKPTAVPARATVVQAAVAAAPTSAPIPSPSPSVAPQQRVHTVVSGDTLTSIASKYYGDASKYTKIYEANKDTLPDPNSLKVGQKLKIPE